MSKRIPKPARSRIKKKEAVALTPSSRSYHLTVDPSGRVGSNVLTGAPWLLNNNKAPAVTQPDGKAIGDKQQ